jgi:hypothetical protein
VKIGRLVCGRADYGDAIRAGAVVAITDAARKLTKPGSLALRRDVDKILLLDNDIVVTESVKLDEVDRHQSLVKV